MAAARMQAPAQVEGLEIPSKGTGKGRPIFDDGPQVHSRALLLQMGHALRPDLTEVASQSLKSMPMPSTPPPEAPCEVHERVDCRATVASGEDTNSTTSVVLINIPVSYNRDMVISLLDKQGFAGSYDFLYLPIDPSSNENLGYLVINFVTAQQCSDFIARFHGALAQSCFPFMRTGQLCEVRTASVQGKQANYDRVRLHSCFGQVAAARAAGSESVAERHLAAEAAAFSAARARAAAAKTKSCEDRETMVRKQIEFYFSSSNLGQDEYLRSLMDASGWIELGQLVKFPRLKSHGVSVQMAAASLASSSCVEVSSDGRRVRHSNAILREVFHAAPKERPPADAPKHGMAASGLSTGVMESKVRQLGKDDVYF